MTQTLVATDFYLAADVSSDLAAKVTFNLVVAFDEVTKCYQLAVVKVLDAGVGVNTGCS